MAGSSQAATLDAIAVINNSSANQTDNGSRPQEFYTSNNLGTVNTVGNTSSFTSHTQWYNGFVGNGGVAQVHPRQVSYDLLFTVLDPSNDGYDLVVDILLQGYSTAIWTSGTNANAVVATGTTFSGRIDTDTSDASNTLNTQLNDLTTSADSGATANNTTPNVTNFDTGTDLYNAGSFVGTRSFALRFTTATNPSTNVFLQNNQTGQGSVRFGINNVLAALNPSGQSQGGELSNPELGHFVGITLTSNASAVPAPAGLVLMTMVGLGLLLRKRGSE